jgi:hypothetical protein
MPWRRLVLVISSNTGADAQAFSKDHAGSKSGEAVSGVVKKRGALGGVAIWRCMSSAFCVMEEGHVRIRL